MGWTACLGSVTSIWAYLLRQLLLAMVIAAITAAAMKLFWPRVRRFDLLASYSVFSAGLAVVAWLAVMAMQATHRPAIWIAPVLIVAALIGRAEMWLIHQRHSQNALARLCTMICSEAICLLVALGVVRWAGYRQKGRESSHSLSLLGSGSESSNRDVRKTRDFRMDMMGRRRRIAGPAHECGLQAGCPSGVQLGRDIAEKQNFAGRKAHVVGDGAVAGRLLLGADRGIVMATEVAQQVAIDRVSEKQFLRMHTP